MADRPSIVVTLAPSSSLSLIAQLFTARPSTITVQAPHSRLSQPYLVPVRLETSRSANNSGVSGSSRYSTPSPLTVILAMIATLACGRPRCQDDNMSRIVTSNGLEIGYSEKGSGEATPIVFLHGVGSDKSVWQPQLNHFGRTRRAIAFDYPGYADSDPALPGTTRDDYATAIISALHRLGIDCAHFCGLSLGGIVAVAVHHQTPHCCASLTLADTFAIHPEGREIYDRSLEGSRDLASMARARVDVLLAQPAREAVKHEVVETMSRIDPAAYRIGAEAVWLADQRGRIRDINIPTLIICGEADQPTPPQLSYELHRSIATSRLELITNAGHLPNIEQPEAFNLILDNFLASIES